VTPSTTNFPETTTVVLGTVTEVRYALVLFSNYWESKTTFQEA
jgi:hypothetical protein